MRSSLEARLVFSQSDSKNGGREDGDKPPLVHERTASLTPTGSQRC